MTDVFYPDRSQFQGRTPFSAHAVCARATEGTWLTDPDFAWNMDHAHKQGALGTAYHFLEDGTTAAAQAAHCHGVVGKRPLMLDFEPIAAASTPAAVPVDDPGSWGHWCGSSNAANPAAADAPPLAAAGQFVSRPGMALAEAFIDAYRKLGGVCHVVYLPHWYWQVLGSPPLKPFTDRHMVLVSSDYTTYSDTGPGWAPYGGMTPTVWQYTDSGPGHQDWNAYKGHATTVDGAVAELESLWATGTIHAAGYRVWETGGKTSMDGVGSATGQRVSNILIDTIKHYGTLDPVIAAYVDEMAAAFGAKIPAGGKLRVRK